MKRRHQRALPALLYCAAFLLPANAAKLPEGDSRARFLEHRMAPSSGASLRLSTAASASKAPVDSFLIYGGPGSLLGKFQNSAGLADWQGWTTHDLTALIGDPVGDFAKLFANLSDPDPCRSNATPQVTFIDDGSDPNNLPGQSTGGSTSPNWSYGNGWVVNFTGGLGGGQSLHNEVWSPEILWNDPNSSLDDAIDGGAFLRYSVFEHLPLVNGIFHTWAVRSFPTPIVGGWSEWRDRGFLYYSDAPSYQRRELQVADLLVQSPTKVQVALGVVDLADVFALPGLDATPSPWFDNVSLVKHDVEAPILSAPSSDFFQDAWPASSAPFSTANLAQSVCRIDNAQDLGFGSLGPVYGDSMVVRAVATRAGASLTGPPTMHWFLRTNSLFDLVRYLPSGAVQLRPDLYSGVVTGTPAVGPSGPVPDLFAFDLPDGPPRLGVAEPTEPSMFFPGDLLLVFVQAQDTMGGSGWITTAPDTNSIPSSEVCGGGIGKRAEKANSEPPAPSEPKPSDPEPNSLPGIWEGDGGKAGPVQPRILVWDDAGSSFELELLRRALSEIGVIEGRDYDVFITTGAELGLGNGLGGRARHAVHLSKYDILFYLAGDMLGPLLSDGTGNGINDRSDDIGILTAWRAQGNDRHVFHFGDNIALGMRAAGLNSTNYLQTVMGVQSIADDVAGDLNTIAPAVVPLLSTVFGESYIAYGGCEPIRRFDKIAPRTGTSAVEGHRFRDLSGTPVSGFSASVWHERYIVINSTTYRHLDVTFPYSLAAIQDEHVPSSDGTSARARLLEELLAAANFTAPGPVTPTAPALPRFALGTPSPNPFNPAVLLPYESSGGARVHAAIYDLRGRLVQVVHDGVLAAGKQSWRWDGRDASGSSVASGVYLLRVSGTGSEAKRKLVLVR